VQHFISTHVYLERHVRNVCQKHFKEKIYVRSKFSFVRSSHDLCARTHARSLKGTLPATPQFSNQIDVAGAEATTRKWRKTWSSLVWTPA